MKRYSTYMLSWDSFVNRNMQHVKEAQNLWIQRLLFGIGIDRAYFLVNVVSPCNIVQNRQIDQVIFC